MVRSVKITTPIPSLEEFGKSLGISKARQRSLIQIMTGNRPGHKTAVRFRQGAKQVVGESTAAGLGKSDRAAAGR